MFQLVASLDDKGQYQQSRDRHQQPGCVVISREMPSIMCRTGATVATMPLKVESMPVTVPSKPTTASGGGGSEEANAAIDDRQIFLPHGAEVAAHLSDRLRLGTSSGVCSGC